MLFESAGAMQRRRIRIGLSGSSFSPRDKCDADDLAVAGFAMRARLTHHIGH
jgi:hypothetical protein